MRFRIHEHAATDSTNERALAAIEAGLAQHGDLHLAESQTAGRGRLGRRWISAPGEGLYLSLIWMPPPPLPAAPALTMAAGLAVLELVRSLGVGTARLEWPNDLAVGGAKLAGCLVESRGLRPDRPHCVVGVGLNVAQLSFPPALAAEREVTSLRLLGVEAAPRSLAEPLAELLAQRLEQAAAQPGELASAYLTALGLRGTRVRATAGALSVEGELVGLSPAEGLVLGLPGGERRRLALEHLGALGPLGRGGSPV